MWSPRPTHLGPLRRTVGSPGSLPQDPTRGCSPGRVAAVGESQVAHAQVVESPQDTQAAVDGVAALHANQTGHLPLLKGLPDAWGGGLHRERSAQQPCSGRPRPPPGGASTHLRYP